jgi:hypothetical protein
VLFQIENTSRVGKKSAINLEKRKWESSPPRMSPDGGLKKREELGARMEKETAILRQNPKRRFRVNRWKCACMEGES